MKLKDIDLLHVAEVVVPITCLIVVLLDLFIWRP